MKSIEIFCSSKFNVEELRMLIGQLGGTLNAVDDATLFTVFPDFDSHLFQFRREDLSSIDSPIKGQPYLELGQDVIRISFYEPDQRYVLKSFLRGLLNSYNCKGQIRNGPLLKNNWEIMHWLDENLAKRTVLYEEDISFQHYLLRSINREGDSFVGLPMVYLENIRNHKVKLNGLDSPTSIQLDRRGLMIGKSNFEMEIPRLDISDVARDVAEDQVQIFINTSGNWELANLSSNGLTKIEVHKYHSRITLTNGSDFALNVAVPVT